MPFFIGHQELENNAVNGDQYGQDRNKSENQSQITLGTFSVGEVAGGRRKIFHALPLGCGNISDDFLVKTPVKYNIFRLLESSDDILENNLCQHL